MRFFSILLVVGMCVLVQGENIQNELKCRPPTEGTSSAYCGDLLPKKLCVWDVIKKEQRDASLYTHEAFMAMNTTEYKSTLCNLMPETVPIPQTKEEYCTMDGCEKDSDCKSHFQVQDKIPRMCFDYCVQCSTSEAVCNQKSGELVFDCDCVSGLWNSTDSGKSCGGSLVFWSITGTIVVIVVIVVIAAILYAYFVLYRKYWRRGHGKKPWEGFEDYNPSEWE